MECQHICIHVLGSSQQGTECFGEQGLDLHRQICTRPHPCSPTHDALHWTHQEIRQMPCLLVSTLSQRTGMFSAVHNAHSGGKNHCTHCVLMLLLPMTHSPILLSFCSKEFEAGSPTICTDATTMKHDASNSKSCDRESQLCTQLGPCCLHHATNNFSNFRCKSACNHTAEN
jgi:hypothetical protein